MLHSQDYSMARVGIGTPQQQHPTALTFRVAHNRHDLVWRKNQGPSCAAVKRSWISCRSLTLGDTTCTGTICS